MNFCFWAYIVFSVLIFIVSVVLVFTADPWLWTGPLALSHIFMQYAREEIKSDRQ